MSKFKSIHSRSHGSVLFVVLILAVVIGAMAGTLITSTLSGYRAATENLQLELAHRYADSGVNYVYAMLNQDKDYLRDLNVPTGPIACGDGSFEITSADEGSTADSWEISVVGISGDSTYSMAAAFGYNKIPIPPGVVATGTGKKTDVVVDIKGNAIVGSYDSSTDVFYPFSPGQEAVVAIDGSITMNGGTTIYGDLSATGKITKTGGAQVTGETTPASAAPDVADIDPIVTSLVTTSAVSNDNGTLAKIFGSSWKPVKAGALNYGDLIVTKGTFTVPAGTYRFRRLEVTGGAKVTFDTSTAPAIIVYIGSGAGTGTKNDLMVSGKGSAISVDSKGSDNGLLTVLAQDCDFVISNKATFGQNLAHTGSGGYTQIISLGGNTSSDDIKAQTGATVYGRIYAAAHTLTITSNSTWYGSAVTRKAYLQGGSGAPANFAVDLSSIGNSLTDKSSYDIYAKWYLPETPY